MKKLLFIFAVLTINTIALAQKNKANRATNTQAAQNASRTNTVYKPNTKVKPVAKNNSMLDEDYKPKQNKLSGGDDPEIMGNKKNFNGAMADLDKAVKPKTISTKPISTRNNFQTTSEDLQQVTKPRSLKQNNLGGGDDLDGITKKPVVQKVSQPRQNVTQQQRVRVKPVNQ